MPPNRLLPGFPFDFSETWPKLRCAIICPTAETMHPNSLLRGLVIPFLLLGALIVQEAARGESVARVWNQQNLRAIRRDFPNPPVHARNLFHLSAAMWDAWAAYDALAIGYVYQRKHSTPERDAARREAISYAAFRVLTRRYSVSVNAEESVAAFRLQMQELGYDPDVSATDGNAPSAVGNRIGTAILGFGDSDRSREPFLYTDFTYFPVNDPLIISNSGAFMFNPNRWQPLAFDVAFTQNGLIADKVQVFVGSHWGQVRPFAMQLRAGEILYHDPGPPPQLGGEGDAEFKARFLDVIRLSSLLDPDQGQMLDISPAARGNNSLGTNDGAGHPVNPATGQPYAPNLVNHADFGRVIAEYWADGPDSETPPGHWNTLANSITEHPAFEPRIGGRNGPLLDPLEWDVKMYFALNASLHDVAVAVWGCKRHYDYVRPISIIRYCGSLGQSSDPGGPSYHPLGLPLEDGLVEIITPATTAPGQRHAHLASSAGKIAIHAWRGEPADPEVDYGGVGWILAADWLPYQRDTFVTPAFAGYVSGHSAFSRAAAEVLAHMTGSPFFPGGLGTYSVPRGGSEFEFGPTTDIELQWGTYYDASDESGISRIYGGIHVAVDDGPGRIIGARCGIDAWQLASRYFNAGIVQPPAITHIQRRNDGSVQITWQAIRGMSYRIDSSTDLHSFMEVMPPRRADSQQETFTLNNNGFQEPERYLRVVRVTGK